MPDPSMIAGKALPAPELPDGTVSVRVVREGLGNNISGQQVTVKAAGVTKTGTTDDAGRAQVTGFTAGAQGTAETTVDGEQLVSDPFEVPGTGGIRIILISGLKELAARKAKEAAAAAAAPPVKGTVIFGGDSRVVMEFNDDNLRVFYILEIVNTARARVDIGGPLIVELPEGAQSAAVLEGSSPNATARGDHVVITGPFASGTTSVQIGFGLPHSRDTVTLRQKWPAAMPQVLVMAQKISNTMTMTSPQFVEHDEATAGTGVPFLLGGGGALPAGGELSVQLSGLPYHSAWPRWSALGLAGLILLAGMMYARTGATGGADLQRRLTDRRESLFAELVKLEEQRRAGRVDGSRYATRRQRLLSDLERVYGELDGMPAAGRTGGGEAAA